MHLPEQWLYSMYPKPCASALIKNITSGTAAAFGLGWVAVTYHHPLGSVWFLQGPELNGGKVHQPCIRIFGLSCHSPGKLYWFWFIILNWVWEECSFRSLHLACPTDQGINVYICAFNCTFGDCGNDHWMCPGIEWAHCEPDLGQATFIYYLEPLCSHSNRRAMLLLWVSSYQCQARPVFNRLQNVWVVPFPRCTHGKRPPMSLGKNWRNHYLIHLSWYHRILPLTEPTSHSIIRFQVHSTCSKLETGQGTMAFYRVTTLSLLIIRPWFLLISD